jgi:F420-non-reducing hydrogenase iron-sulfur subunit
MAQMLKHYGLCENCDRDATCTLRRSARLAIIECEEFAATQPRASRTSKARRTMSLDQYEQYMSIPFKVRSMEEFRSLTVPAGIRSQAHGITVFVCANCARPGRNMASDGRPRPVVPDFEWPFPVQQIIIPCAGRLQPEHVLKAFGSGVSLVLVIACAEDNCHYLEGSKRCARRVDYVRSILEEIGLDGERLMLFHLPGSAVEDMALAAGKPAPANAMGVSDAQVSAIRDEVQRALMVLPQNPIPDFPKGAVTGDFNHEELDISEDNNNE